MNNSITLLRKIITALNENPDEKTLELILSLREDEELYFQFWARIANHQALAWFYRVGLISETTLQEKHGRAQLFFLSRSIDKVPGIVDSIIDIFHFNPNVHNAESMLISMAISAPSTALIPNLINKITSRECKFEVNESIYHLGELAKKLKNERNGKFQEFNLKSISSFRRDGHGKSEGHGIDQYFKESEQPDESLGDHNIDCVRSLCGILIETTSSEGGEVDDILGPNSTIWLSSFNEDNTSLDWDAKAIICRLIVRFGNCVCENVEGGLARIITFLQSCKYPIFKRIEFHLVGCNGSIDDILPIISTREYFDDPLLKNEMANIFRMWFVKLPTSVADLVLSWIDDGPTEPHSGKYDKHWRFCKLSWIRDCLTGERAVQFQALMAEFGPEALSLADRNHYMSSGWGHTSPVSVDELSALQIEEVVKFVSNWTQEPQRSFRAPSLEGLADTFGSAITANPVSWSKNAMAIAGMKPHFVSRAFNSWLGHAREHGDLDWSALMDLVDHILQVEVYVGNHGETSGEHGSMSLDTNWSWTRQCIADLIGKACDQGADFNLRPRFISALSKMTQDDPPTRKLNDIECVQRDHSTDALNCARGKVANALCDLAVWTAKNDPSWDGGQGQFAGNIAIFEDVMALIESQLADVSNANAAIWAAYALRANQLRWLAPEWFSRVILDRLRLEQANPGLKAPWAFWLTFLRFHRAHRVWLQAMRSQYEFTAQWIKTLNMESQSKIQSISDFFEHLMVYYWQRDLDLVDHGVIKCAFANASTSQRKKAMAFVGRALKQGDTPPENIAERFRALWAWYWQSYGASDFVGANTDERKHSIFGEWLASGHLGASWSLSAFIDYIKADNNADHGDDEFEQMAKWCNDHAMFVLQAAHLLILGDQHGWRVHLWKRSIETIMKTTRSSMDIKVQEARLILLETLFRRGQVDYLLSEIASATN